MRIMLVWKGSRSVSRLFPPPFQSRVFKPINFLYLTFKCNCFEYFLNARQFPVVAFWKTVFAANFLFPLRFELKEKH